MGLLFQVLAGPCGHVEDNMMWSASALPSAGSCHCQHELESVLHTGRSEVGEAEVGGAAGAGYSSRVQPGGPNCKDIGQGTSLTVIGKLAYPSAKGVSKLPSGQADRVDNAPVASSPLGDFFQRPFLMGCHFP